MLLLTRHALIHIAGSPLSTVGVPLSLWLLLLSHTLPLQTLEAILLLHPSLRLTHAHVHLTNVQAAWNLRRHQRRSSSVYGIEPALSYVRSAMSSRRLWRQSSGSVACHCRRDRRGTHGSRVVACKDIKRVAHGRRRSGTCLLYKTRENRYFAYKRRIYRLQVQLQNSTERTGDWAATVCAVDGGTGSDILTTQSRR